MSDQQQPALEGAAKQAVDMLSDMARKVALNATNGFAGVFVIVPPEGEPRELLLLNNTQHPAMFWSLVQTMAKMAIDDLEEQERQAGGPGMHRR